MLVTSHGSDPKSLLNQLIATVASETVKAEVDWLLDSMAALIIHTEQPSDNSDLRAGRTSAS